MHPSDPGPSRSRPFPQKRLKARRSLAYQRIASYCVGGMKRSSRWILYAVACTLLLVLGAVLVVMDSLSFRERETKTFRAACLQRSLAFEELAEQWVVRDQVELLEGTASLLLQGSVQQILVEVQGRTVLSMLDDGLEDGFADVSLIAPEDELLPRERYGASGALQVDVPLVLSGYPDRSIGRIYMEFSSEALRDRVLGRTVRGGGIAAGIWALVSVGGFLVLRSAKRASTAMGGATDAALPEVLQVDFERREVAIGEVPIDLSRKLYELLVLFVEHPGQIYSDQDLLDALWSDSEYATSADIKQHIYLLRKQLGKAHPDPKTLIENVRGFGYRLGARALDQEIDEESDA